MSKRQTIASLFGVRKYGETDFVTGLRAIAAVGVVLIHSGGGGLRELSWPPAANLADLGGAGPFVFFVISGFAVASSWVGLSGQNHAFRRYFLSRLSRILPLYFLWLTVAIFLASKSLSAWNIASHFLLISWVDPSIANSILGVEWSIPIEIFWYFFVPWLVVSIKSSRLALIAIPVAGLLTVVLRRLLEYLSTNYGIFSNPDGPSFQWTPFPYLFAYVLGVAAFRIRNDPELIWVRSPIFLAAVPVGLVIWMYYPQVEALVGGRYPFIATLTFILLVSINPEKSVFARVLSSPPFLFGGQFSYGLYLSHIVILKFVDLELPLLRFVVTLAVSYVISALLSRYFETPMRGLISRALTKK